LPARIGQMRNEYYRLRLRAEDLGVPVEVLICNDIFLAHTDLLDFAKRVYRKEKPRLEDLDKIIDKMRQAVVNLEDCRRLGYD